MADDTKLRVGPGWLRINAVGGTEPTDLSTPWDTSWTLLGYTEEGHEAAIEPNFEPLEVAEELTPVDYIETSRNMRVSFSLAEMTAQHLKYALNGGTVTGPDDALRLIGTATIVASTGVITTSVAHGLVVGDKVKTGTVTTTTGITSNTVYYVKTAPSASTVTLSATSGGSALSLTGDGSLSALSEVTGTITVFEPPEIGVVTKVAIGWEAMDGLERWVWRKCIQTGSVTLARRKAPAKTLIACEFRVMKSSGVVPFRAIFG